MSRNKMKLNLLKSNPIRPCNLCSCEGVEVENGATSEPLGRGKYTVKIGKDLIEYDHWDKIPAEFDHLISFHPDIPPGPHTQQQHDQIDELPTIFQGFMKRERK